MRIKLKNKTLSITIKILLGLVFIVSAIAKLKSIDSFEIYLYSFSILDLDFSYLFARFIISLELFIGVLLLIGIYSKKVIQFTIALLSVFTVFILFLLLNKNNENCHCFGDMLTMSNIASVIKNIILTFLLILIYNSPDFKFRFKKIALTVSLISCIAITFIISPPDTFYYSKFSKNINYNKELLSNYIEEHKEFKEEKQILCFFGTSCRFCKLAAQKMSVIANKTNKAELIHYVFWGTEESIPVFFDETNSLTFSHSTLQQDTFLRVTEGHMPLIILLENGVLKKKYSYRSINEQEFIDFLKDNKE